jgi:transposase
MVPYSIDLRQRVLAAVDAGEQTQQQIARRFTVSTRWIRKLVARRGEAAEALRDVIARNPDATPDELRQAIGFEGCTVTVWRAIERLRITRKKTRLAKFP